MNECFSGFLHTYTSVLNYCYMEIVNCDLSFVEFVRKMAILEIYCTVYEYLQKTCYLTGFWTLRFFYLNFFALFCTIILKKLTMVCCA